MANLETLIKKTYTAMGEPSDLPETDLTVVVIAKINDVIRRLAQGKIASLMSNEMIQGKYLPFLSGTYVFDIIDSQALTGAVAIGATTLSVKTTNFPATGAVLIDNVVIAYTAKTLTTLTVAATTLSFKSGTTVYPLYTLPIDCSIPTALRKDGYDIMYNSDMNQLNQRIYYTIINGKMYISGIKGRLTLKYQKLPKVLVSTIDVCDLIDADEIIAKISAGEILYDLEEVDDAQTKLIQGYKMLREYYAYYSSLIKKQNTIQAQPFNLYSTYARNSYRNR